MKDTVWKPSTHPAAFNFCSICYRNKIYRGIYSHIFTVAVAHCDSIDYFQQEAAVCQELHSHPTLHHIHPEGCGSVHKGRCPLLKWRHQPLHPFYSKTATFWGQEVHGLVTDAILHLALCPSSLPVSSVQFACKASVVFCHYCVMANFFWLLVEALYLNSLLLSSFCHSRRCLWGFSLLGWGEKHSSVWSWLESVQEMVSNTCNWAVLYLALCPKGDERPIGTTASITITHLIQAKPETLPAQLQSPNKLN